MNKKIIYHKDFVLVYYDNHPIWYNKEYWEFLQKENKKYKEWTFRFLITRT